LGLVDRGAPKKSVVTDIRGGRKGDPEWRVESWRFRLLRVRDRRERYGAKTKFARRTRDSVQKRGLGKGKRREGGGKEVF